MIHKFKVLAAHHAFLVEACVSPGRPGKLYGQPEDCYPADPAEIEVESIVMTLGTRKRVVEWDSINTKAQDSILEDIEEQYAEMAREDYDDRD